MGRFSSGRATRYGLAFGLLVWALIAPPIRDGVPVPDAPTDAWKPHGFFETRPACQNALDLMRRMVGNGKYGWERPYWHDLARCEER